MMFFILREDWSYLLFIFMGLLLLDILGLISLSNLRNFKIKLQRLIKRKYTILSIGIEIIGITIIIVSISLPWWYLEYIGMLNGFIYLPITEGMNISHLLLDFIFRTYIIGILVLIMNILLKKKINIKISLELIELILLSLVSILLTNVRYIGCDEGFQIPEYHCIRAGYFIGYFLYLLGICILITNGLQISIYTRLKRSKKYFRRE